MLKWVKRMSLLKIYLSQLLSSIHVAVTHVIAVTLVTAVTLATAGTLATAVTLVTAVTLIIAVTLVTANDRKSKKFQCSGIEGTFKWTVILPGKKNIEGCIKVLFYLCFRHNCVKLTFMTETHFI